MLIARWGNRMLPRFKTAYWISLTLSDVDQYRQSKLSAAELEELQRATHFDKKELQQWYKGMESVQVLSL